MNAFLKALARHRGHKGFRSEAAYGTMGFSCDCGGHRESVMVPTLMLQKTLHETLHEARVDLARRRGQPPAGTRAKRLEQRRSDRRARALLCRYLNRDQIRMFKHIGEFLVKGQDGATYRLRERRIHGIEKLNEEGVVTHRLCIVAKDYNIPVCDTILAQKVLLENDVKSLHKTANTTVVEERRVGSFWNLGVQVMEIPPAPVRFPLDAQGRGAPEMFLNNRVAYVDEQGEALYDVIGEREPIVGYVLGHNGYTHPCFDHGRIQIPKLWNVNVLQGIINLILGMPVIRCRSRQAVIQYFLELDLVGIHALCHPETPVERILGSPMFVFEDERIPPGRTYFMASAEFFGVIAHWEDGGIGFGIHNPQAIVQMEM